MQIFADYIQPLTHWLYQHPDLALLITFLISFAESLAIVGSLVPGSITMTAIGILAGSGVMRVDLTLLAAILGAVAGDSGSYALGYYFSDRLADIWPFKRYPKWISYGREYFNRHGGKSVLIGRFAGPLRSIIPVIAGMMRMRQLHFLSANILSAIGWSILYIMPGIFIGTASHELSPEQATRLFTGILLLLVLSWLAGQGVRWLYIKLKRFIHAQLDQLWKLAEQRSVIGPILNKLTPTDEATHDTSITLFTLLIISCISSMALISLMMHVSYTNTINQSVLHFLQSFRTHAFDTVFVYISLLFQPLSVLLLLVTMMLVSATLKDWRLFRYLLSLELSSGFLFGLFAFIIPLSSFTIILLVVVFSFLMFYFHQHITVERQQQLILRALVLFMLVLVGLIPLYFGDDYFIPLISTYLISFSVGLLHWILFRRHNIKSSHLPSALLLSLLSLIPATALEYFLHFDQLLQDHHLVTQQYKLSHHAWWDQNKPVLPIYTINRIGKRTGLFNLQYVGSLKHLEQALINYGWESQPNTLLYSLMMRAQKLDASKEFPLIAQLYLNKKPMLTMRYVTSHNKIYVLRLWESNYHLLDHKKTIWLGSIVYPQSNNKNPALTIFNHLVPALAGFSYTQKTLIDNQSTYRNVLIIEEAPHHKVDQS